MAIRYDQQTAGIGPRATHVLEVDTYADKFTRYYTYGINDTARATYRAHEWAKRNGGIATLRLRRLSTGRESIRRYA